MVKKSKWTPSEEPDPWNPRELGEEKLSFVMNVDEWQDLLTTRKGWLNSLDKIREQIKKLGAQGRLKGEYYLEDEKW